MRPFRQRFGGKGVAEVLVLSRKVGQKLVVPALGLSVEILGVAGDRVRLGIEAPPGLTVLRNELLERTDTSPSPAIEAAPAG